MSNTRSQTRTCIDRLQLLGWPLAGVVTMELGGHRLKFDRFFGFAWSAPRAPVALHPPYKFGGRFLEEALPQKRGVALQLGPAMIDERQQKLDIARVTKPHLV